MLLFFFPLSAVCERLEIKFGKTMNMHIFLGFLTGGHVLRLFHGHMDECLAIATPEEGEEKRRYEAKGANLNPLI